MEGLINSCYNPTTMKKVKTALITGSSQGIGKAIAEKLAENGYTVYITYHTNEKLGRAVAKKIAENGGNARLLKLDVRSEKSVKSAFECIKNDFGHLNVLVNNAGVHVPKNIETLSFKEWSSVVETKINGNFLSVKHALPLMKGQDNANVIVIASALGERPIPEDPAYSVGTAGTIAFMKSMALYLGKYGIRTNAIAPGPTQTALWKKMGGNDQKLWDIFAKNNPLGRVTKTENIGQAVLMLIEDKSNFLNGNIIYMNGGSHLL
jgi:NAD(P)-dependent dehydrogenase (short-subunit alcohol dehydrogenase family)